MSIAGYASWPAYDTFLIVLLSGWPVYDPNPLRPNPNPEKPVSGSCRVRGLGRTLTPLSESVFVPSTLVTKIWSSWCCYLVVWLSLSLISRVVVNFCGFMLIFSLWVRWLSGLCWFSAWFVGWVRRFLFIFFSLICVVDAVRFDGAGIYDFSELIGFCE